MTNNDYIKFYDECLNNNLTITKYYPVKDQLFKIIKYYDNQGVFDYSWYNHGINLLKLNFVKDLLRIFSYIMATKEVGNLDEYVDFLLDLDVWYEDIDNFLIIFLYKNKFDGEINNTYYPDFIRLCHNICGKINNNNNYIEELKSDTRIINIIKLFGKYYKNHYVISLSNKESNHREFYYSVAPLIIARFYITNLDLEYLNSILDEVSYNCENTKLYYEHNSGDILRLIDELINKYNSQKKIIK